jgi:hypothetical protein
MAGGLNQVDLDGRFGKIGCNLAYNIYHHCAQRALLYCTNLPWYYYYYHGAGLMAVVTGEFAENKLCQGRSGWSVEVLGKN